jgi:hypothetical protein
MLRLVMDAPGVGPVEVHFHYVAFDADSSGIDISAVVIASGSQVDDETAHRLATHFQRRADECEGFAEWLWDECSADLNR